MVVCIFALIFHNKIIYYAIPYRLVVVNYYKFFRFKSITDSTKHQTGRNTDEITKAVFDLMLDLEKKSFHLPIYKSMI